MITTDEKTKRLYIIIMAVGLMGVVAGVLAGQMSICGLGFMTIVTGIFGMLVNVRRL